MDISRKGPCLRSRVEPFGAGDFLHDRKDGSHAFSLEGRLRFRFGHPDSFFDIHAREQQPAR